MKGDFSRNTFDRSKRYSSVRMQQGRVQLDADWNEQIDIQNYRDRNGRRDIIGHCGAPQKDALSGFEVMNPSGVMLEISGGHYYVGGLLCENETDGLSIAAQPDLAGVDPTAVLGTTGNYAVYLDVWERHITDLDDESIREVALNGPDTATRTQVVWQVKTLAIGDETCNDLGPGWVPPGDVSSGELAARAQRDSGGDNICIVPAKAGYRRIENQLYRVEVHQPGPLDTAIFKWSRENGSVIALWDDQDGNKLTVSSSGRDENLGFRAEDWVELIDDTRILQGRPGVLVRVLNVSGRVLQIDATSIQDPDNPAATGVDRSVFPRNPKVRRWESEGAEPVTVPVTNDGWLKLEDGVQVKFSTGQYRTGDYWMIPARTVTGDVDWPVDDGSGEPLSQKRQGIKHHYCPLARVQSDGTAITSILDCRGLFPPLTALTQLYYVGGDGQEALPGESLAQALETGVANGQQPVEGAVVEFLLTAGTGVLTSGADSGNRVTATTAANGVASCNWQLDSSTGSQRVEARLLAAGSNRILAAPLPVHFNANLSIADDVAYDPSRCPDLAGAQTVQDAIDRLCRRQGGGCAVTVGEGGFATLEEAIKTALEQGVTKLCICLLPGTHQVNGGLELNGKGKSLALHITGCGRESVVENSKPWRLTEFSSFALSSLDMVFSSNGDVLLGLDNCGDINIHDCQLSGVSKEKIVLGVKGADRFYLSNSVIEALGPDTLVTPGKVFTDVDNDLLKLFQPSPAGRFRLGAEKLAAGLSRRNAADRRTLVRKMETNIEQLGTQLSAGELKAYRSVTAALTARKVNPRILAVALDNVRGAAAIKVPGQAIVLADGEAETVFKHNTILGALSVYGVVSNGRLAGEKPGLSAADLKKLGAMLRDKQITINGTAAEWRVQGNRIARVLTGDEFLKRIQGLVNNDDAKGVISGVYENAFWTDNTLAFGLNEWAVESLSLTNTSFADPGRDAGMVVATSAVYVGNSAANDIRLFNSAPAMAEAATLALNIVDL